MNALLLKSSLLLALLATSGIAIAAEPQGKDADKDSIHSEARGRTTDASQIDKRAVEVNWVDETPKSSERIVRIPREVYILRGSSRDLDVIENTKTIPGVVTPGSVTPGKLASTPRFDSGEDILTPDYRVQLDDIIAKVKGRSNLRFNLIGHTDTQRIKKELLPRFPDNPALGLARAKQVGGYLKEKLALPDSAFTFETRGPDEPLATPKEDTKNWPVNRRVAVEVFYQDIVAERVAPAVIERTVTKLDPTVCQTLTAPEPIEAGSPFRVSIDGQPVDSKRIQHEADKQRCIDVALEKNRLAIQYDNLRLARSLNVTPFPAAAKIGEATTFRGWSNYLYFIKKAEVHLFSLNDVKQAEPIAIVPMNDKLQSSWTPPANLPEVIYYKLRVYDAAGNFDETMVMPLAIVKDRKPVDDTLPTQQELLAGYGENRLDVKNISVTGGTLTVHGQNIAKGERVAVFGMDTPVDEKGAFVMEQIVPRTYNTAEVAVTGVDGKSRVYRRDLALPKNDWFFVGIADFTLGKNKVTGPAAQLTQDTQHYNNDRYTDGRLAFFSKGIINDEWAFTGAVDTLNEPISKIFRNFNYKDTRSLFNRIDPSETWPTFGDNSSITYDAPTQGKIFAKIDNGKSSLLWGNFKESFGETQLAQFSRGLYGANGRYQSEGSTSFGERKIKVEGFAADPGTVAAREDFRGTGGSLYYLRHQDLTRGSDRVRIEIRDRDSGLIVAVRPLSPEVDYTIDYLQGRVLLSTALPTFADDSQLIHAGGLAGNPTYLVADYEYTPTTLNADSMVYGGRISGWVNDNLKLGITGTKQELTGGNQNLNGVDITLRKTDATFIKLESGRSTGTGVGNLNSPDGGFNFASQPQSANAKISAKANRIEAQADLKDFNASRGRIAGYWQSREAGYSAPGEITDRDIKQFGLRGSFPLSENVDLNAKFDNRNETNGTDLQTGALDVGFKINKNWALLVGAKQDKRSQDAFVGTAPASVNTFTPVNFGNRTDVGVRLDYLAEKDWAAYGFGQYTANRTGGRLSNDRLGFGGRYRVSDKTNLLGEISGGSSGAAGKAGVEYLVSDRSSTYLNYQIDSDRNDDGLGSRNGAFVVGGKSQFTDQLAMFTEHKYSIGNEGGLTNIYGVTLTPQDKWSYGANLENGYVGREAANQIKRQAIGFKVNYAGTDAKYGSALEWRKDVSALDNRKTVLWRNNLTYKTSDDWRLLGRLDLSNSDSSQGSAFAANFRDAMLGFAYRPVNNDRWNTLVRFQYLYDLAPQSQLSSSAVPVDYAQRSKVAALDTNYDLTERWTVGGKVAIRKGDLRLSRDDTSPWFKSSAILYVLRADYKIIRNWDFLAEVRRLNADEAGKRRGYLLALYYDINENARFGGGYNFANFSDDVTNLSYRSRGPFINLIGKW